MTNGQPTQQQRNGFITIVQTLFAIFLIALLAFCFGVIAHTLVWLFSVGWDQIQP
jgi:hypothetical protein